MNRHRLHYADWSWQEYAAAFGSILRGQVADGPNPDRLLARLARSYAPSTVYPVNYGHTAIRIALDIFRRQQPKRTEVLVPEYICPSVIETIAEAGLCAVAVDIGSDLNMTPATLAARLGPTTLAVIAPHMFGSPCAISEIERQCRDAGVFLIDDAAQVVGERSEGRLLGTFGDLGIISFAQSKAVVTGVRGSGGVLLVNDPQLDPPAKAAWQRLPAPSGRLGAFVYFLWNYLWAGYTGNSGYYLARLGRALGLGQRGRQQSARISNLEAGIALAQLERLPQLRAAKIAAAEAYHAALARLPGVTFPQYAPGRYLSRVMLSAPPHVDTAALLRELDRNGIGTRLGYLTPVRPDIADSPDGAAARRLFGVPFGAHLKHDQINKICSILALAIDAQGQPLPSHINNNETHQTTPQR